MKADGHIHTPFCPHGTDDTFEQYILHAIKRGFTEISFTEHAPLPTGFIDPTPDKDSGMDMSKLEDYFSVLTDLKRKYKTEIKINIGLEVDYIEDYEEETRQFLNSYGSYLDDSILSVHFLKQQNNYFCMDFSEDVFGQMIPIFSSIEAIYEKYYQTLYKSITADLGIHKPKRIGHITLIHKFQKKYPINRDFFPAVRNILTEIAQNGLQLDYNGAGVSKPLCGEPYPPETIIKEAIKQKIPLVYGSDAHSAKDLEQGYEYLYQESNLSSPTIKKNFSKS
jgi:histidinol-phosphatase (PHP family)